MEENKHNCPCENQDDIDRRSFLTRISLTFGALASLIAGVPIIGVFASAVTDKKKEKWRNVGLINKFPIGSTTLVSFEDSEPQVWGKQISKTGAWLRRLDIENFEAFTINCAHLGCPVRWIADAELFLCPCHGGVYYKNGDVASGPPPKPLSKYPVRIVDNHVEILSQGIPITTI